MKKQLILCNLAWLTITFLIITHTGAATKETASTNHVFAPPPGCPEDYVDFLDPKFFFDGLERYKNIQWEASNNKLRSTPGVSSDFQDARSCWYSLRRLKNLICLTEANAARHNLTGELGIRFYYATYPDTATQEVIPPGLSLPRIVNVPVGLHHTLFMVPTHYNEQLKLDEDIYLVRTARFNTTTKRYVIQESNAGFVTAQKLMKMQNSAPGSPIKIMVLGQTASSDPSSKNQGMLCPPTCPPGTN